MKQNENQNDNKNESPDVHARIDIQFHDNRGTGTEENQGLRHRRSDAPVSRWYARTDEYLAKNIKYPPKAEKKGIEGKVMINFIVEKDGSISNAKVVRHIHPLLDKEAERVIKAMPKWSPGKQEGKPVRVKFNIPVAFRLK